MRRFLALLGVLLALGVSPAFAGNSQYSPTLEVSFPNGTEYGSMFRVTGCGYQQITVTLGAYSPEYRASRQGVQPDANGCISVDAFMLVGPGDYKVVAEQQLHNGQPTRVAEVDFVL